MQLNDTLRSQVRAVLIGLRTERRVPHEGICANLSCGLRRTGLEYYIRLKIRRIAERRMTAWPQYSGFPTYPVPAPLDDAQADDAQDAYVLYCTSLWDASKPYGASRYELLEWLIQDVENWT